jgi:hypothetical protein
MRLHVAEDVPDKLTVEGATFANYATFEKWLKRVTAIADVLWPLEPPPGDATGSKKDGG